MQKRLRAFLYRLSLCIVMALITIATTGFLTTVGKVVDNHGRPVEGAVIVILPGIEAAGLSDSEGQFKITWSPRSLQDQGMAPYIVARHKDKNLGLAVPIDNDTETLKLVLKPGVSVSGKVVDTEGKAIASVRLSVMLRTSNWGSTIDSQRQTDSDGVFKFNALPVENRYQFTAGAVGYGQKDIEFDAEDAVNGHIDLGRFELPLANMSISGQVVDSTGHPVPNIEVFCFGEGQPSCNTFSDEEGYFELSGLCAGLVRFMAEGRVLDKRVSRQVLTEAGARDVKVVVKEGGYSRSYYVRTRSHKEIINSGNPYIAGWVVDEDGMAVAQVPVNVRYMRSKNEKGRNTESYFNTIKFGDVTDKQGRFVVELQEKDAVYSLLFSPSNHAAIIVYDLVTGTRDLKVTLPKGGTITGRLVRISRGRKVPVPNAKVELKQTSRLSYSHIGYDRDRKTMADSEGRFRFEHIRTLMRTDRKQSVFGPRVWELSYEGISQNVMFYPDEEVKHIDLVIRPNIVEASSLIGQALPDHTGLDIDFSQDRFRDEKFLICFFDYQQRPSRQYILQLNNRFAQLAEQGLNIIAVQTTKTSEIELGGWIKRMNISIPVFTITGDINETRFIWNVRSLPWLILIDNKHIVTAEGFGLDELDDKIRRTGDGK